MEYDRATGYMLGLTIEYNRRKARRNQALTGAEVRNKVCENMLAAGIFEDKAFTFKEDVVYAGTEELRGAFGMGPSPLAPQPFVLRSHSTHPLAPHTHYPLPALNLDPGEENA